MIGELQRKLTELSHNPSPAVGPVNGGPRRGSGGGSSKAGEGDGLDMDALGLGLAALEGAQGGRGGGDDDGAEAQRSKRADSASTADGREVMTESVP